jgi:predicted nuclease of predicted toxin-antitoxin system
MKTFGKRWPSRRPAWQTKSKNLPFLEVPFGPRPAAEHSAAPAGRGLDAVHTAEIELATASDSEILARGVAEDRIVVTLDADFHALLALSGAMKPSVIRFRTEGLRSEHLSKAIRMIMREFEKDLRQGTAISVRENSVRLHHLPLA